MKRAFFTIVAAVIMMFAVFYVTAAEIQSDGTGIVITNETEDAVWTDSNGGRAVWDKQNATFTLDNFNLKCIYRTAAGTYQYCRSARCCRRKDTIQTQRE